MALGKTCIWAVSTIIFALHLIAFCLAVGAEQHRTSAFVDYNAAGNFYFCNYSSDRSSGMAAGAFVTLLVAHILALAMTKCFCCAKGDLRGGAKACAIVSFVLLWICWFIASVCMLAGANRNSIHTKTKSMDINRFPLSCETMRRGTFGAAAAFTFFSFILGEIYFLLVAFSGEAIRSGPAGYGTGWQGQAGTTFPPQQSPYAL